SRQTKTLSGMRWQHIVLRRTLVSALLLLCAAPLLTTLGLRSASAATAPQEWDGLELRNDRRVDRLFVRPGASLAGQHQEYPCRRVRKDRYAEAGERWLSGRQ